jgi:hypothetical protein
VVRVWDLVLDRADGPSSLTASLSIAAELLEGQVDIATANGVCWWDPVSVACHLVALLELETDLELLGSRHNGDLMEDQMDALWTLVRSTSDSLVAHILPSFACGRLDGARE